MKKTIVIAVTGVGRSGKDSLADGLKKVFGELVPHKKVVRYAFADELKKELRDVFSRLYMVDSENIPDDKKQIYRDMYIAHGKIRRAESENKYWWSIVDQKMNSDQPDIAIISDLRYILGINSEYEWLKKNHDGILIHVERYLDDNMEFVAPPVSEEEAENDPELKEAADYNISWHSVGKEGVKSLAYDKAKEFYFKNINMLI